MTRTEYLDTKSPFKFNSLEDCQFRHNIHVEFFSQFVTNGTKYYAGMILKEHANYIQKDKINESLNEIPLAIWDRYAKIQSDMDFNSKVWKECEHPEWHLENKGKILISLSDKLCFLKCAARMILQSKGWKELWEYGEFGYWECILVKE
jgi:hypothetical protein